MFKEQKVKPIRVIQNNTFPQEPKIENTKQNTDEDLWNKSFAKAKTNKYAEEMAKTFKEIWT